MKYYCSAGLRWQVRFRFSLKKWRGENHRKKDLFINDEIRVREVRLVGLDGEQLGIKPLSEAQAAADDANVDLVLIQPQATPPVSYNFV